MPVTDQALEQIGKRRDVTLSVKFFLILPDNLRASDMVAVLLSCLVACMGGLIVTEPSVEVPGFVKTSAWYERTIMTRCSAGCASSCSFPAPIGSIQQ